MTTPTDSTYANNPDRWDSTPQWPGQVVVDMTGNPTEMPRPGDGIVLVSPDGSQKVKLSVDNTGKLEIDSL